MKLTRAEANTIANVVTDLLFIAGAMSMHDAARKRVIEHAETLTALVGESQLDRSDYADAATQAAGRS